MGDISEETVTKIIKAYTQMSQQKDFNRLEVHAIMIEEDTLGSIDSSPEENRQHFLEQLQKDNVHIKKILKTIKDEISKKKEKRNALKSIVKKLKQEETSHLDRWMKIKAEIETVRREIDFLHKSIIVKELH